MLAHTVLQCLQQQFVVDWFLQKFRCTGLERTPAHLHSAMPRQHDDGLLHALGHQRVQHGQAADAGHAHVQHDDAYALAVKPVQKRLWIGPGLYPQPHSADQQCQAFPHGLVVIHQVNQGRQLRAHDSLPV